MTVHGPQSSAASPVPCFQSSASNSTESWPSHTPAVSPRLNTPPSTRSLVNAIGAIHVNSEGPRLYCSPLRLSPSNCDTSIVCNHEILRSLLTPTDPSRLQRASPNSRHSHSRPAALPLPADQVNTLRMNSGRTGHCHQCAIENKSSCAITG